MTPNFAWIFAALILTLVWLQVTGRLNIAQIIGHAINLTLRPRAPFPELPTATVAPASNLASTVAHVPPPDPIRYQSTMMPLIYSYTADELSVLPSPTLMRALTIALDRDKADQAERDRIRTLLDAMAVHMAAPPSVTAPVAATAPN